MASQTTSPIKTSCHCGAIRITLPHRPEEILECQCTLCRRYGAAWAYYHPKTVEIHATKELGRYLWGDADHGFFWCTVCGCLMYWKGVEERDKMGVNTRMIEPDKIRTVNRRISFGALRTPLKDKNLAHLEDQAQY